MTCVLLSGAAAAPVKGGSTTSSWQLDVTFHDPQRIAFRLPGDGYETTFWYMLYRVTNNTQRDVEFYPSFRLVTDTLQVVEGGADISPSVYDAIEARHKREFPFLAAPAKVTGRLLQGEENARASVAVFRMFDKAASSFTIYGSGFSSEVRRIANPAFVDSRGELRDNPRSFILRRTLAIFYDLPGDAGTRWRATPVRRTRKWVMR
jgi:hypothetical protein